MALASAGLVAFVLHGPRHAVGAGLADLRGADPVWLVAAALAFVASGVASAAAWQRGLCACGAQLGRWQVIRRYWAGSFANTLAPANAGDVVRVGLVSRAIGTEGAAFTTVGVAAAVSLVRAAIVAVLFVAAVAHGHSLLWLGPGTLAVAVVLGGGRWFASTRPGSRGLTRIGRPSNTHQASGRAAHLLDVVRGVTARPGAALELCAWLLVSTAAKVLAAACAGAALGLHHPLAAALVIVPALELAALFPLTPGNIGMTSAAVAIALRGQGVPLAAAIGTGIAVHAVETLVGLGFGGACALSFAPRPTPRVAWLLAGAAGAALLAGAVTTAVVGVELG